MQTTLIAIAAVISVIWFLVHLILGGRDALNPLMDAPAPDMPTKAVFWMVWHMVTGVLLLLAVLFAASILYQSTGLLLAATALSGTIMAAGIIAHLVLPVRFAELPQGYLFVPKTALGMIVLLS